MPLIRSDLMLSGHLKGNVRLDLPFLVPFMPVTEALCAQYLDSPPNASLYRPSSRTHHIVAGYTVPADFADAGAAAGIDPAIAVAVADNTEADHPIAAIVVAVAVVESAFPNL